MADRIYRKLIIYDGSYALHRSLHIPEMFNLRNPITGERTGGCFGTLKIINSELKKNPEYFPIVVFDNGLASRRLNVYPQYKNADTRNNDTSLLTPEELDNDYITQYRKQRNKLAEILPYFGIPVLKYKGWEGDDLQKIMSELSEDTIVLTDDRDMLQMLNEHCRVRRPMADEMWDEKSFVESKGFDDISDFIIYKAVMGDNSDNIPSSCKGVGAASINEFIRLLKTFRIDDNNYNFGNYPMDVDSMKTYCNERGIAYKKGYLNFDKRQFLINLELVDLNLVKKDITDDIINSIKATIDNDSQSSDYFKAIAALSELAIKDIPADEIISAVAMRKGNLKL